MSTHGTLGGARRPTAFTLIELLTVVAIITLLIGLLVPALGKARDSAKNAKTRATMKAIGDGLELFRNANDKELRTQSYPSSAAGDDPTEEGDGSAPGTEDMCGAQWVVRYLLGKKLDGYVARETVPPAFLDPAFCTDPNGFGQKGWYNNPGDTDHGGWPSGGPSTALDRRGPYVEGVTLKAPKELPGSLVPKDDTTPRYNNPVIVDSFTMPILYYAANTRQAERPNANIATFRGPPIDYAGIYTFRDNAMFTGMCAEAFCISPGWDLGGGTTHKLTFGPQDWTGLTPPKWAEVVGNYPNSFAYYIMDKGAFESTAGSDASGTTKKNSVIPSRKNTFLLISPGKDGIFGTKDDVTNF